MSFRVVTPAEETLVTTLEVLKEELPGQTAGKSDAALTRMLRRVTSEIVGYLGVPAAADGSRNIGLETIEETVWRSPWLRGTSKEIVLSRMPATEIVSIVAGNTAITSGFELDGGASILRRIRIEDEPSISFDRTSQTVIRYKAGWTLPGDDPDDYTMPAELEAAALTMLQMAFSARSLDPNVKSQWVLDVERLDFWVGQIGENGSMPPSITAKLDPYRYPTTIG